MTIERAFRIITIITFIPAFALCTASGIKTAHDREYWMRSTPPVVYFGSVPAFFSAATSLGVLWLNKRRSVRLDYAARTDTHRAARLVIDTVLAAGYISLLIPLWILDVRVVARLGDASMLLAYATMPLLINCFIHTYLVTVDLIPALTRIVTAARRKISAASNTATATCPRCQGEWATGKSPEGYHLLRTENVDDDFAEMSESRVSAEA